MYTMYIVRQQKFICAIEQKSIATSISSYIPATALQKQYIIASAKCTKPQTISIVLYSRAFGVGGTIG
jgi:hypothetical protein